MGLDLGKSRNGQILENTRDLSLLCCILLNKNSNKLLENIAKEQQEEVIKQYANVPGCIASVTSAGGIKMALWRERNAANPRPAIPSSHAEFMDQIIPDAYSKTADGEEFLLSREWVDDSRSMCIFLSNFGADILRKHSTWCLDGTFKTCPLPFVQVLSLINIKFMTLEEQQEYKTVGSRIVRILLRERCNKIPIGVTKS